MSDQPYERKNIHGTNPQFLIEKILRERIYESAYWKEKLFGVSAETLLDRAVELQAIGGQFGSQKPTEFICLALKILQLQPDDEIITLFLTNSDFKYLTALAAFYIRLTESHSQVYRRLEPLLQDRRKLRRRTNVGGYELTFMDQFISDLLLEDRMCDTILPRLTKRYILEDQGDLEPRASPLDMELDDLDAEESIQSLDDFQQHSDEKPHTKDVRVVSSNSSPILHHKSDVTKRIKTNEDDRSTRHEARSSDRTQYQGRSSYRENKGDYESSRRSYRDERDERDRRSYRDERDRRSRSAYHDDDRSRNRSRRSRSPSSEREEYRRNSRTKTNGLDGHSNENQDTHNGKVGRSEAFDSNLKSANSIDAASSHGSRVKHTWSRKRVDALFKKPGSKKPDAGSTQQVEKSGGGGSEVLSVDEANKIRASLGLKPLQN
ncbi:hypothetical protein QVD99_004762 [Batrachochytrium dendrobatidis]|nr:hypothetical protein QVD99_004762 [Batrachochytrium dendrobatidis]